LEYVIFIFCLIGCGLQSWWIGRRNGVQTTVDYLLDEGYLELDEEKEDD
jgi:hypothetical protein